MVGTLEAPVSPRGMDDYLTKLLDAKRLEEVLARFVTKNTSVDLPAAAAALARPAILPRLQ